MEDGARRPVAASAGKSAPEQPKTGPGIPAQMSLGEVRVWGPHMVYTGRSTKFGDTQWGKPFIVGKDGSLARCVELYTRFPHLSCF